MKALRHLSLVRLWEMYKVATDIVLASELGIEFDIGIAVPSKIIVKTDGTSVQRNAGTGVISAAPASWDNVTKTITFPAQDGAAPQVIDLSAFTTDVRVDGGTFNATSMVLTLTDNDAGTPDVVIDLSALLGVSANAGNLLNDGTDGKALLVAADVTALATITNTSVFGTALGKAFP